MSKLCVDEVIPGFHRVEIVEFYVTDSSETFVHILDQALFTFCERTDLNKLVLSFSSINCIFQSSVQVLTKFRSQLEKLFRLELKLVSKMAKYLV